jgi:sulfate adenylyltransferase
MRLRNGNVWPIPLTLDVDAEFAEKISIGEAIGLYDFDNTLLATMTITDKWKPNKNFEALQVFGTTDEKHPAVHYLMQQAGEWYLGGPIQLVNYPKHYDFIELRNTPARLKISFQAAICKNIIGFQTRNPMHRAHLELTLRAAELNDSHILIHPVV